MLLSRIARLATPRTRLAFTPVTCKRNAAGYMCVACPAARGARDPCPSLKPDTHDQEGKPYMMNGLAFVVPKVVFSPEWLIESPPFAHTWEEPPIFYDIEEGEDEVEAKH
ncbi:hypothetical protein T492DRAFT_917682 [Pavlovales sp. CCMP2436]|nr:hypothetical protein T492DRAFT_917682 [Pavlovales sp. CCMP2436]